jgi:plasmid stabilization system protein ParE
VREAETELREIVRYTARQWGAGQAQAYARLMDEAATDLALGQGVFKEWSDVLPGLRVKAAGSHFAYCGPANRLWCWPYCMSAWT